VVAAARKPGSVARFGCPQRAGDHSSGALVTERLVRPTQELGRATLERSSTWPCSGWGLPCRVRYRTRGGRLLHLFTLASAVKRRRFAFLWHFPRGRPHRALPGILPCGARTFLSTDNPSSDRLSRCGGATLAPPGATLVIQTSRGQRRPCGRAHAAESRLKRSPARRESSSMRRRSLRLVRTSSCRARSRDTPSRRPISARLSSSS